MGSPRQGHAPFLPANESASRSVASPVRPTSAILQNEKGTKVRINQFKIVIDKNGVTILPLDHYPLDGPAQCSICASFPQQEWPFFLLLIVFLAIAGFQSCARSEGSNSGVPDKSPVAAADVVTISAESRINARNAVRGSPSYKNEPEPRSFKARTQRLTNRDFSISI